jgi:transcriptional regulator with GAF, ATPase, and Fis domain
LDVFTYDSKITTGGKSMRLNALHEITVNHIITERTKERPRESLAKALKAKGLTMSKAAKKLGVNVSTVSRHVHKVRNPRMDTLEKYRKMGVPAQALGL